MTQNKFIEEVINAIGKRKRASEEKKHAFASCLYEKLSSAVNGTCHTYNDDLARVSLSTGEIRHHEPAAYLIAKMIAEQYHQSFSFPSTGKGKKNAYEKIKITPYDRVCRVVVNYFKIGLPSHTLRKVVNDIRSIRVIESTRSLKSVRGVKGSGTIIESGGIRGVGGIRGA